MRTEIRVLVVEVLREVALRTRQVGTPLGESLVAGFPDCIPFAIFYTGINDFSMY